MKTVLLKHWKKLVVLLLFAGSFAAAVAWVEPRPRLVLATPRGVEMARFSPNGETLVTGTALDRGPKQITAQLWDISSGQEKLRIDVESENRFLFPALLGDQRTLLLWAVDELRAIDIVSGREVLKVSGIIGPSLSQDGSTVAYFMKPDDPYPLVVWDTATRKVRFSLPCDGDFAVSPDGKTIASTVWRNHRGEVILSESLTGKTLAIAEAPRLWHIVHFGFNRDGTKLVSVGTEEGSGSWPEISAEMTITDARTGKTCSRQRMLITGLTYPPKGTNAGITLYQVHEGGRSLTVWDESTGQEYGPFRNVVVSNDSFAHVIFSPDGRSLLVANYLDVEESPVLRWVRRLLGLQGAKSCGIYEIRLLDVETGKQQTVFRQDADGTSYNIQFSPDGKTLAIWWSDGQAVYLWDIPPRKPWLRMLAWSAGPVAGLLLLVQLYKLLTRRAARAAR